MVHSWSGLETGVGATPPATGDRNWIAGAEMAEEGSFVERENEVELTSRAAAVPQVEEGHASQPIEGHVHLGTFDTLELVLERA